MTFSEILALERDNHNQIILFREGIFWKAYEKSAFLICEHIRPFKTSKKCVKSLGSTCMIYIGFPEATEEQLFRNLERAEDEGTRRVYNCTFPFDEESFLQWKDDTPVKERKVNTPSCENASDIEERLRSFDLALATPMDCMMLVAELKKMLH